MRVFVSSTIYDLIDVRGEIASLLRSLDIQPVMSDDKLSDFELRFDKNSIETCLINVESCDEVVVILDKRYGPSLKAAGYDDVSATHLEFRHAVKTGRVIHFFARDRLLADHAVWKKNRRDSSMAYAWVQPSSYQLFNFLDERCRLHRGQKKSNWFSSFSNSVDLVQALRQHFERRIGPETLTNAIYENRFPFFKVDLNAEGLVMDHVQCLKLAVSLKNIGGATAFNLKMYWEDEKNSAGVKNADQAPVSHVMVPGGSTGMQMILGLGPELLGTSKFLIVEYDTPIGIAVKERFKISGGVRPGPQPTIFSGVTLTNRTFRRSDRVLLELDD